MTLIEKKIFLTLSLLFATVFAQQRQKPINLLVKEDFPHPSTSVIFPVLWSGFQREAIFSYDQQNKHVAVSYVQQKTKKTKTTITLYLYPQIYIDNQMQRDAFASYEYALNQSSNRGTELQPQFGNLSNDQVKVHYIYSTFDHSMGQADFFKGIKYTEKKSLLSIYECGGWTFKIRISSDDMTKDQLVELKNKIEAYFSILDIASRQPLPIEKVPNTLLSAVVKRDSMMIHATIAAAEAKINWLEENLEKKELLAGFNDMDIRSEVHSIEKMLIFYKAHEKDWPMHDDTKKYFSEMIRIADNGRIKDYIYYKYNGLINYPEGAQKKDDYVQFRIDKDISENVNEIFYKLYYKWE